MFDLRWKVEALISALAVFLLVAAIINMV